MEALPRVDSVVLLQRGHEYKYARCAALAGARVEWVDDVAAALEGEPPAAILHPAHLDARALGIDEVAPLARAAGVPVVVDAAYLSFPLDELARWSAAGDVACFSAKYFWGPNAGGFVAGRAEPVGALAALDFTGYEYGPWLTFGRAWKLDRGDRRGHDGRAGGVAGARSCRAPGRRGGAGAGAGGAAWQAGGGTGRAAALHARRARGGRGARSTPRSFAGHRDLTRRAGGARAERAGYVPGREALVFCTEALTAPEVSEVADALSALWPN